MMDILLLFPGFIVALIIVFCYECKIRRTEPMNKVHFYVARDKSGCLYLYLGKPKRADFSFIPCKDVYCFVDMLNFRKYGLNPYDFKDLKWEDEPVEVFINMED